MQERFKGLDIHIHDARSFGVGQFLIIGQYDRRTLALGQFSDQCAGGSGLFFSLHLAIGKRLAVGAFGRLISSYPLRHAQAVNREVDRHALEPRC